MKTKTRRASRAKVRRLRFRGPDGTTYQRTQAVENNIGEILPLPHAERAARAPFVLNETLVYFIRRCDNKNEHYYTEFCDEFHKRLVDLGDRYTRGLPQGIAEDIVGRVRTEFLQLVLDERNSRKVEFLEVAFAHAVKQRTLDIVRVYLNSPWAKQADTAFGDDGDEEEVTERELGRIPDGNPGPEAALLDKESVALCRKLYEKALDFITDPLDRQLAALHWGEGWPVVSKVPGKADLVTYSRTTEGRVKRSLKRAMKQMRDGMGLE